MPNVQFFLQDPNDHHATFASTHELYLINTGAAARRLFILDTDHPSCMKVSAIGVSAGVYKTVSVLGSVKHVVELAYKVSSGNRLQINIFDMNNNATIYRTFVTSPTWANFYKEVTTPATCRLMRLWLLKATTGSRNKYFYIDDVKIQGNALYADPDSYVPDYQDISNDHQVGITKVTDRLGRHVAFNMSFPTLSATGFNRLMQAGKGAYPTYFNDAFVPIVTELFTVRATNSKTFLGVTVGNASKARFTQTNAVPLAAGDMGGASFSNADYTDIGIDDNNAVTGAITGTGHYGYHKFTFRVTSYNSKDHIKKIAMTYKGQSIDSSNEGVHGVNLLAWNGYSWVMLARSRTPDKQTLTFETAKPEQAKQFVDVTGGYVRMMVQTRATKASGALTLKSYYVEARVNEDLGRSLVLLNKALLTANGSVASVKNLSTATVLNKGTSGKANSYSVGDDRKKVTVDNAQVSGSMIEVKYNQYYNVYIDSIQRANIYAGNIRNPNQTVNMVLRTIVPIEKG
jgi:hypothetical protein